MKKSKTLLIVIIIILVLLLGAGGTFAYLFLATDTFKSDKEMFFNYLTQAYSEENGFIDSNLNKLEDNKKNSPYKNEGELSVKVSVPKEIEESMGEAIKKTNDLKIGFSGNVNNLAKKFEQEIEIDYGNDAKIPFKVKFDGDIFGIQNNSISKKKYIAIENKNLKELAQKFDVDASIISVIPDKIEFDELQSKITFSKDEINQLLQNYGNVLNEQLSKDKFSKAKTIDGMEYNLTLNGDETKNLIIKLLENAKQDSILKNKFNEYLKMSNMSDEDMDFGELVKEIIDSFEKMDSSGMKDLKISLNVVDKKINQINIQSGSDFKVSITRSNGTDNVNYKIELNINVDDSNQINMTFNCDYTGIQSLEKVGQKYELGFEIVSEGKKISYNYTLDNNIEFTALNNAESLTESNAIIINDYDAETIQELMTQIIERIELLNKKQMEKLGLEENENPLIYSNFIINILLEEPEIVSNAQEAKYLNKQGEVTDKMLLAFNSVKTEIKVKSAVESDYKATEKDNIEALAFIAYRELGGTKNESNSLTVDGYTVSVSGNKITIEYEDADFSTTGKFKETIKCEIDISDNDASKTGPNKPINNRR